MKLLAKLRLVRRATAARRAHTSAQATDTAARRQIQGKQAIGTKTANGYVIKR